MAKHDASTPSVIDWKALADKAPDEYPKTPDVPAGYWRLKCLAAKFDEDNGVAWFMAKPLEPVANGGVSEEAYEAFKDYLDTATIFQRYDLSRVMNIQMLQQLLTTFKLNEVKTRDGVPALKGVEMTAEVIHKPRNEGGNFVNLRHIAPA